MHLREMHLINCIYNDMIIYSSNFLALIIYHQAGQISRFLSQPLKRYEVAELNCSLIYKIFEMLSWTE